MKKNLPTELLYQIFALLIAFIVMHALYVAVIRPNADADLRAKAEMLAANPDAITEDSFYVVLKDYEQESCLVLMLWAFAILAYKGRDTWRQQRLGERDLLDLPPGMPIGKEDTRLLSERLAALPAQMRDWVLPRALATAIERFAATGNVQDVSTAARDVCDSEGGRMETELSIIRYIAWAIPSVGFIGTVRGIGDALGQAHKAVEGDITGVTESLGVAFNSTFIALVISIVLMFFIHQIQLMQERLVLDAERYVDREFIRKLRS
ncbi:MAG: MotA/TolQ/ExbB proton channel family protein [Gammaproteobacteria bacterium]|nr:MotA/TolQ/ExbB proton channel family protein [Gammaproteobacteria bacterium]MCP5138076.1 MotA/TolQ/ExbB proton channel family protein [Gammaproteobacteria bacterium]